MKEYRTLGQLEDVPQAGAESEGLGIACYVDLVFLLSLGY